MRLLSRPDDVSFEDWKDALNRASFFYSFSQYTGTRVPTPATVNALNNKLEMRLMARGTKAGKNFGRNSDMPEFVHYPLSEEEKDIFQDWRVKASQQFDELMEQALSEGHKISISWDDNNQTFIAAATCRDEDSRNYNMVLTSRWDDYATAMLSLFYKMYVIFNKKQWEGKERKEQFG